IHPPASSSPKPSPPPSCMSKARSFAASYHLFSFDTPPSPQIYPLSLHDALPISRRKPLACTTVPGSGVPTTGFVSCTPDPGTVVDRKSTRLNSSHRTISYAVFCLKKKNNFLYLCALTLVFI